MDHHSLSALFTLLIILVVVSAFFSGSEIGMMSLNPYRLRNLVRKKNSSAIRVSKLLKRPDRLLGVILIGNTFANIIASAVATIIGQRLWGDIGVLISTISLTFVILIFSEMAPKTLAALNSQAVAFISSRILVWLLKIFAPLVWLVNLISITFLKCFGVNVKDEQKSSLSRDELRTVVSEAGSLIPNSHKKMLTSILDLEKVTVDDIMVPRNEIIGLDISQSIEEIYEQLETVQHTRLAVYDGDIDKILGLVHLRSVLNSLVDKSLTVQEIKDLSQKCYFVPEGTGLHQQLINFQNKKQRSCLVVDEYGEIKGLVTLEDILEEIVGEFTSDMASTVKDIYPQEDGSTLIDGSASIRDINKVLKWNLPTNGPKTLSGLIIENLGFIPPAHSCMKISNYPMEVLQVKDNMIKTVKVIKI